MVAPQVARLRSDWERTREKQRAVGELRYAADSWGRERRVVTSLEYGAQGNNPRFIVTNLSWDAERLYDEFYCMRGEAENRMNSLGKRGTSAARRKIARGQCQCIAAAIKLPTATHFRA